MQHTISEFNSCQKTSSNGTISSSDSEMPKQEADAAALIKYLKTMLIKDDAGQSYHRESLKDIAYRLSIALETPGDTVQRVAYYPMRVAVIRVALKLDLFNILVKSGEPKSGKELADMTGTDHTLLIRFLRYLAATHTIAEVGVDSYAANNVSKNLTIPALAAGVCFTSDLNCFMSLLKFVERTNYQNPTDNKFSPFHLAHRVEDPFWQWLPKHSELLNNFNLWMMGQRDGRANWLDFFPFEEQVSMGFDMTVNEALFVDVGGARGHEIKALKARYPALPGRIVLQDLPHTVEQALPVDGMEVMAHDFFTAQPVKGARAYYLRSIFHDWPDHKCQIILQQLAAVMVRDYSKIVINEMVLPNQGASVIATQIDMAMLSILGGMERTEKQWHELLNSVGLKIVHVWMDDQDAEAVIEAELK